MIKCNKIEYNSKKDAVKSVRVIHAKGRNGKGRSFARQSPYLCDKCECWHTTSLPRSESKKIAKKSKEIRRRLSIIKALIQDNTINNVIKLQESWMTLFVDGKNSKLKCRVFDEERVVSISGCN